MNDLPVKILLVYPEFPDTFWSFKHALKFVQKKAGAPPLGLLTVAAMLPPEWEKRLVDLNVTGLTEKDLKWADYVFISAMVVQRESAQAVIATLQESRREGGGRRAALYDGTRALPGRGSFCAERGRGDSRHRSCATWNRAAPNASTARPNTRISTKPRCPFGGWRISSITIQSVSNSHAAVPSIAISAM